MADVARWNAFDDREALTRALATRIADALRAAIAKNGRALFGVSGGSTPIPVYRELAQTDLPWHDVDVVLVDERFVPPTHRDSNEAMVRRELLQRAAAHARFTALWNEADDVQHAAALADSQVESLERDLDIGLIGMGDDGHYASIFPAGSGMLAAGGGHMSDDVRGLFDITSDRIHEIERNALLKVRQPSPAIARELQIPVPSAAQRRVVATVPDPLPSGAPHARLTLTLPFLLRAAWLPLAFTGSTKKSVYEHAGEATPPLPIARLRALAGSRLEVFWAE